MVTQIVYPIETTHTSLRPVVSTDLKDYQQLFSDSIAMRFYRGGPRDITDRFQKWVQRWDFHPYSALAVIDKVSNRVIGHAILGHGDYENDNPTRGWSEIAGVMDSSYKPTDGGSEINTEVLRALVGYARSLKENTKLVPSDVTEAQQEGLEKLCSDNPEALQVHRDTESKKIAWVYLPLCEIRATCALVNKATYQALQTVFIQENHGRMKASSDPDRDLFTISLE